jgi:hypothetical protein
MKVKLSSIDHLYAAFKCGTIADTVECHAEILSHPKQISTKEE